LGDPEWPKSAVATGGKFAYQDDQETPNTLLASYDFGGRELVFEVRGVLTGGEGGVQRRAAGRGGRGGAAPGGPTPPAKCGRHAGQFANERDGRQSVLWHRGAGLSMSDQGYQAYKGESNELLAEEKPTGGDTTGLHMQNFLAACRSRNYKELHDGIENAYLSAALCHLGNISLSGGRKLTIEAGPRFAAIPKPTS